MITKTLTRVSFIFNDGNLEYQKGFKNQLEYFCNNQPDVVLAVYLEKLLELEKLIKEEKVEQIVVNYSLFYDFECETDFSPKIMALMLRLNATFAISSQRVGESNLYTTLDKLRKRPALFISSHSISALASYIDGFREGCNYENSESPSFDGFNDFVGEFYGKYTTAGWKNLILADHFGNEEEALTRFFVLLDEFRLESNKPSSREIVFRLIHVAMLDFRAEDEHQRQSQLADLLHHVSKQLQTASYGGISVWYDSILQDVFDRARGNQYLHNWLKANAPSVIFYEHEIWKNSSNDGMLLKSNQENKNEALNSQDIFYASFYAISEEKANEIKNKWEEV
jgi:hypothetical protein